jgi:hypothetical protein
MVLKNMVAMNKLVVTASSNSVLHKCARTKTEPEKSDKSLATSRRR